MTNPQNNSNLPPWKWAIIGAGSTLVFGGSVTAGDIGGSSSSNVGGNVSRND
ncbi:hypothetical protein [Microcoleus sp. CAWBG640]|uniref:hypothetical protein n=1 Tax=Microcoleus sp. CAWBG640 TaxID=2841653 RepID=UPI00312B481A